MIRSWGSSDPFPSSIPLIGLDPNSDINHGSRTIYEEFYHTQQTLRSEGPTSAAQDHKALGYKPGPKNDYGTYERRNDETGLLDKFEAQRDTK